MVMTPDSPSFPLQSLDAAVAASNAINEKATDFNWTEDEEGILQSVSVYHLLVLPRETTSDNPR